MRSDAEAESGPTWAARRDPRVTPVGRILRKLHLDELPQLWNVFRGDMAFIGPRPERPEFVEHLSKEIPHYRRRLTILPGITGLAQIRLPPDSDLQGVRAKLAQDLQYLDQASPLLDLRIMGCTALRIIGIPGIWSARLFRLHAVGPLPAVAKSDEKGTRLSTLVRGAGSDARGTAASHRRSKGRRRAR